MRWVPCTRFALFSLVMVIVALGCTKRDYIGDIELPEETALTDAVRYAVVMEPYVTFRDMPQDDGITSAHARAGEVFEVQAIKLEMVGGEQVMWVLLKDAGWLVASSLRFYPSKEQATVAARKLK